MTEKLHIGLTAQGGAGWAGGSEYIRNLARAVRVARPDVKLTLLCGEPQAADWKAHAELFDAVLAFPVRKQRGLLRRLRGRNRELREAIRASGVNFVFPFTYDNAYNLGVNFPLGDLGAAWAGWIPDFQHRHLPQLFSEKERNKRDAGIAALVEEAPRVVLSSESAAEDFRRFYPGHAHKAFVLTFGTFPNADWYVDFGGEDLGWLPGRYFAVCNQFWAHKNHAVVFRALELLAQRVVRPTIVCTGALVDFRQPDFVEGLLQQIHRAGLGAQVMMLGMVPRRLQIEIIRRSLAVVQPSLFEGWSTVVEDARVLGKPTLLSDLAVHQEQNPPGARFFPREDASALAAVLEESWHALQPGPDGEAERAARAARAVAEVRVGEIGRNLIKLAEGCVR